jgi:hypothetical protein
VEEDVERLHVLLDEAQEASELPDAASAYDALQAFVVRVRLDGFGGGQDVVPGAEGVPAGLPAPGGVLER